MRRMTVQRRAAKIVASLDHRRIEALQRVRQRHDHEQQPAIDKAQDDRAVVVEQFDRLVGKAGHAQHIGDDSGLAQQHHPAERAHELRDPERQQAEQQQHRLHTPLRDARDVERNRKRQHQGHRRHENRHDRRARESAPVKRLGEELEIIAETE